MPLPNLIDMSAPLVQRHVWISGDRHYELTLVPTVAAGSSGQVKPSWLLSWSNAPGGGRCCVLPPGMAWSVNYLSDMLGGPGAIVFARAIGSWLRDQGFSVED